MVTDPTDLSAEELRRRYTAAVREANTLADEMERRRNAAANRAGGGDGDAA